jgi:hypothetical protein
VGTLTSLLSLGSRLCRPCFYCCCFGCDWGRLDGFLRIFCNALRRKTRRRSITRPRIGRVHGYVFGPGRAVRVRVHAGQCRHPGMRTEAGVCLLLAVTSGAFECAIVDA